MAGGDFSAGAPIRRGRFTSPVVRRRARIEIIPLIDVMFFLLASFMMVSLSMQQAHTVPMTLAAATQSQADFKADLFNIGVERNGNVRVGTNLVDFARLDEELARSWKKGTNTPVFVTADRDTPHGSVARVLDRVRRAGFQRVSFVTATATPSASGPAAAPPRP